MKKLILTAILTLVAGAAYAGTDVGATISTTATGVAITSADGKQIGKLSASVGLAYKGGTGGYAIAAAHTKGTKAFGTSFDSTAIYSIDGNTATLSASDSAQFVGGSWTAM